MRLLAQTFLTHRQMGESEAYYRMFPMLHLKDSNIKTLFVRTGFRSKRHKYLCAVDSEQNKSLSCETAYIIKGREQAGNFVEKTSVHDLYEHRPSCIEKTSLSQLQLCMRTFHISRKVLYLLKEHQK